MAVQVPNSPDLDTRMEGPYTENWFKANQEMAGHIFDTLTQAGYQAGHIEQVASAFLIFGGLKGAQFVGEHGGEAIRENESLDGVKDWMLELIANIQERAEQTDPKLAEFRKEHPFNGTHSKDRPSLRYKAKPVQPAT